MIVLYAPLPGNVKNHVHFADSDAAYASRNGKLYTPSCAADGNVIEQLVRMTSQVGPSASVWLVPGVEV